MSLRLFIAIEPSEAVRREARRAADHLRAALPGLRARYADAGNAHLTLVFLGHVEAPALPAVERAIAGASRTTRPFAARTAGLGAFPAAHRPSVLWLGLEDPQGALAALQAALADGLAAFVDVERRQHFVPHLTLARVPSLGPTPRTAVADALAAFVPERVPWAVEETVLFRSDLGTEGARHTALLRARLASAG